MPHHAVETTALVWGAVGTCCGWQAYQGEPRFYSNLLMPAVHRCINPEMAHRLAIKLASWGLVPRCRIEDDPVLKTKVFGKVFNNPIGVAAGFDKHAEAMAGMERIGFGFVEVGSVTPLPQDGNPRPRVFRLPEDYAVINRYGFNSCGHRVAAKRLKAYKSDDCHNVILGVNLGKNKTSPSSADDYVMGVRALGRFADYVVINVSSPNTPGLRKLQEGEQLEHICSSVIVARDKLKNKPPVLVKIAPDLNEEERQEIAKAVIKSALPPPVLVLHPLQPSLCIPPRRSVVWCKARQELADYKGRVVALHFVIMERHLPTKVDGLIVSNTTIERPKSLRSENKKQKGGLSGRPLRDVTTALISDMYKHTGGKIPIIGVGGIWNGYDAYEKIRAGASLVQLYTALVYEGPPLVGSVKEQLTFFLKHDKFSNISEAVGADHR